MSTREDQFLLALDHLPVGVMLTDPDLRVTYLNTAQLEVIKRIAGERRLSDVVGHRAADVCPVFSLEEWEGIATRVAAGGEVARWPKLPCPRVNPSSFVSVDIIPMEAVDGRPSGLVCLTDDVTRDTALDRELIRKERLALVGQAAVALLQEISNPLTAALGSAEALLFSPAVTGDVRKRIETIKLNALRVVEITRKLRELEDVQLTEYLQRGPIYITAEPRSS